MLFRSCFKMSFRARPTRTSCYGFASEFRLSLSAAVPPFRPCRRLIFDSVCGFVSAGVLRAFGNHEVGFDVGCVLQQLQGFVAVLEAVGAADAEDEALGGHGDLLVVRLRLSETGTFR